MIVKEYRSPEISMPHKLHPDTETLRLNLVAPASWIHKVDDWRRQQADLPNISEAIRRLVNIGLLETTKRRTRKRKTTPQMMG